MSRNPTIADAQMGPVELSDSLDNGEHPRQELQR
jgi:hypothetical protein